MRYFLGGATLLASGVLFAVGALMNWEFGVSLATGENSKLIYGAASVAVDVLKMLAPFGLVYWISRERWVYATVSLLLFIVCAGYSWTSSIGFASKNRGLVAAKQGVAADNFKAQRSELSRITAALKNYPKYRPDGVVQYLIAKEAIKTVRINKQRQSLAKATNNCTSSNWAARRHCSTWLDLKKEMGLAKAHAKLKSRREVLNSELSNAPAVAANPQAAFIAKLSGFSLSDVEIGLTLLIALVIEAGSSIGYFLSAGFILRANDDTAFAGKKVPVQKAANLNVRQHASTIASSSDGPAKTEEDKLAFAVWLSGSVAIGQGSEPVASSELCEMFNLTMSRNMKPHVFGRLMKQACGDENTLSEPSGTFYRVHVKGGQKRAA